MATYSTRVKIYTSERSMQSGIKRMERSGWEVVSVQTVEQGYGFFKTCCLGLIFLPLALLGRKPHIYQVTFRRSS